MLRSQLYILLIASMLIASCNDTDSSNAKVIDQSLLNKPEQIIYKIDVSFIDSNYTKARLSADSGFTYNSTNRTILKQNINVMFFAKESMKIISTLTADSVVIDDNTKNMTAYGNVKVKSDSTYTTLETKLLQWDNKTRKLFTPEYVKVTSPNEILQGYGFESDEKLSYYKIFKAKGEQR